LAWRRISASGILPKGQIRALRGEAQQISFDAVRYQQLLCDALTRLRDAGIEPVHVKGWSIARLYSEFGCRPCGDIDLCVPGERMADAIAALADGGESCRDVDLHAGLADLDDHSWDEVVHRSRLVPLGGSSVRILGAEDQLRHLCLHLMRHGAFRPLWLCDVAVALETLPAEFDWKYCLSGQHVLTEWVLCAIGLAQRLLGAHSDAAEIVRRTEALPEWLERTVLRLWGQGSRSSDVVTTDISLMRPRLGLALRQRWSNPIRAAYKLGLSPFTRLPRPLIQSAAFAVRAGHAIVSRLNLRNLSRQHLFDLHASRIR
jgi:hypothetical protein